MGMPRSGRRLAETVRTIDKALNLGTRFGRSGRHLAIPRHKTMLALEVASAGDIDLALAIVEAATGQIECPGCEERLYYAEVLPLKGWMLATKGNTYGAEECDLASLKWARKQQAKSCELRTGISLARLWKQQRRSKDARDLLASIYNWSNEGFDTKELTDPRRCSRNCHDAVSEPQARKGEGFLRRRRSVNFSGSDTSYPEEHSAVDLPPLLMPWSDRGRRASAIGKSPRGARTAGCGRSATVSTRPEAEVAIAKKRTPKLN